MSAVRYTVAELVELLTLAYADWCERCLESGAWSTTTPFAADLYAGTGWSATEAHDLELFVQNGPHAAQ